MAPSANLIGLYYLLLAGQESLHQISPPQGYLNENRRILEARNRSAWQVALIDPDSRLLLQAPGQAEVHRAFQTEDFPRLSAVCHCSILLSGGAQTRATRLNNFVEALLRGQLPDLPADWHFMPPLS